MSLLTIAFIAPVLRRHGDSRGWPGLPRSGCTRARRHRCEIPTTPAPTTRPAWCVRMLREVVLFESLFKANKWIWIFGWMFHSALLLVLLRHLRYFTEPVWSWVA